MKIRLFAILLISFLGTFPASQLRAQVIEQGNHTITVQYGFPNLYNLFLRATYNNSGYTGLTLNGVGPIGLQYEYLITESVGFGVKMNYSNTMLKYSANDVVYDANGNSQTNKYNYTYSIPRFRFMPRFTYHFANSDNFDGYMGIAAGYSALSIRLKTNDPAQPNLKQSNPIPIGFRIDIGGNYYFTENLGLNFEIGLGGGPVINFGLSYKFRVAEAHVDGPNYR